MPRLLAVGHVTFDRRDTGFVLSGSVTYASVTVTRLGWKAGVLTCAGPDFDSSRDLPQAETYVPPSLATSKFANTYDSTAIAARCFFRARGTSNFRPCLRPGGIRTPSTGRPDRRDRRVHQILQGKRVVLIDDSIVRGTTSRKIVGMVRAAGATEVHLRISSPPTTGPCYYGIDTPLKSELIASTHSVEEIRGYVGADSLAYLSHEGLLKAVGDASGSRHCTACFSARYPVAVTQADESQLRLFEKARA